MVAAGADGAQKRRRVGRGGYHHGDLASALVAAAADLIDEAGAEAVTLRKVAQRVGVSAAALSHHYRDKEAMLAAVAESSFRDLHDALSRVGGDHAAEPALRSVMSAYVDFALRRPERFRFMFEARFLDPGQHAVSSAASLACYGLLRDKVSAVFGPRSQTASLGIWSVVHGLSVILMTSRIPASDRPAGPDAKVVELICEWILGPIQKR